MKNVFRTAEEILSSESDDLCELARLAGYDPRIMYLDADLSGVDLSNQDVSFLVGLNADYRHAILNAEQRSYLMVHDPGWIAPEKRNMWSAISALRLEIVEHYLTEIGALDGNRAVYEELLEPLRKGRDQGAAIFSEDDYICLFVSKLVSQWEGLKGLREQKQLFEVLAKGRFRFRESVAMELQQATPLSFYSRNFLSVFQLDNCTAGFLTSALEYVARQETDNMFRLISQMIEKLEEIPDRLAAFALTKRPPQKLALTILTRLTDNNLVKEKVALGNLLVEQTTKGKTVRDFTKALNSAPAIRLAYLGTAMKSSTSDVAFAALQMRLREHKPLGSIELSDVAYHLTDLNSRIKYARQTEPVLSTHQHRILVSEIEKIAKTREEKQRVRRIWPKHF